MIGKRIKSLSIAAVLILLSNPLISLEMKELESEIMNRLSLNHVVYQGGNAYSIKIINDIKSKAVLPSLCNAFLTENFLYVDYLVKDLVVSYLRNRDHSIKAPDIVVANYQKYLLENKKELIPVISMFASYIQAKGKIIKDMEASPKHNIALTDLKAIAVRNILPLKYSDTGKLMFKVCIAGEGFMDYAKRNTELEAFTFETIMNAMKNGSLKSCTDRCTQIVESLNLSKEPEIAIKRAQGVFWALLFLDPDFLKLLMDKYNKKKAYLPFILELE